MQRTGMAIWDAVQIAQGQCALWRFPQRSIWVERVESEWHVLSLPEHGAEARASLMPRAQKPESSQWRHYLHDESGALQPSPVLPDRPLVVRPDRSLTLLPGQSTLFYIELPVWFMLSTAGQRAARIFEEPLGSLTRTWFGDPVTGELCWGLATRLHHRLDSAQPRSWLSVCPLAIENDSETDLVFEKICLHVENLNLFRGPERLWTNSLNAVFKGPEQATQIEIVHGPPSYEQGVDLVQPARQPATGLNIRRTFGMLKYFTDF
jgi:hypothetical protein